MSLRKYTKEWLEEVCKESFSLSEMVQKLGRKVAGGNISHLKKKLIEYEIDHSHFKGNAWAKGLTKENTPSLAGKKHYTIEEVFIKDSTLQRKIVRKYVIDFNLIPYFCESCGNAGSWFGQLMALELDHINGISNDHRLENLRWLCPNCHSITPTFGGKNNRS
jgi:5-methylcytosine-specific restriction endonuclease McrA